MINFERLKNHKSEYRIAFKSAQPFELLIIDDFLTQEGLRSLNTLKLMRTPSSSEISSDFIFAKNKIENPLIEQISTPLESLRNELLSTEFITFLSYISDQNLFIDDKFAGGGLHQGGEGSFLEMHTDFSRHPEKREWIRELNLLLYLNHGWEESWGGKLDLMNSETGNSRSIDPIENRLVIMRSKSHTVHGYKSIRFPKDCFRTSVAAYAYVLDDGSEEVEYRSTTWIPKSGLGRYLAPFVNWMVPLKQKLLGSRTADRARRKTCAK